MADKVDLAEKKKNLALWVYGLGNSSLPSSYLPL